MQIMGNNIGAESTQNDDDNRPIELSADDQVAQIELREKRDRDIIFAANISMGSGCDGRILKFTPMPPDDILVPYKTRKPQLFELMHNKSIWIYIHFRITSDNIIYCTSRFSSKVLLQLLRHNEHINPYMCMSWTPQKKNIDTINAELAAAADNMDDLREDIPVLITNELLHLLLLRQPHAMHMIVNFYNKISPNNRILADLIGIPPDANAEEYVLLYNLQNSSRSFKIQHTEAWIECSKSNIRDVLCGANASAEFKSKVLKLCPPCGIMILIYLFETSGSGEHYIPYAADNIRDILEFANGASPEDNYYYQHMLYKRAYWSLNNYFNCGAFFMLKKIVDSVTKTFHMVAELYPQYLYLFFEKHRLHKENAAPTFRCAVDNIFPNDGTCVIKFVKDNLVRCPWFLSIFPRELFCELDIDVPLLRDIVRNFPVQNNPLADYIEEIIAIVYTPTINIIAGTFYNKQTMSGMYYSFLHDFVLPSRESDKGIMSIQMYAQYPNSARLTEILLDCFCKCPILLNYIDPPTVSDVLAQIAAIHRRKIDIIYNIGALNLDIQHLIAQSYIHGADNYQHINDYLAATKS
jgi:hypothetical protein